MDDVMRVLRMLSTAGDPVRASYLPSDMQDALREACDEGLVEVVSISNDMRAHYALTIKGRDTLADAQDEMQPDLPPDLDLDAAVSHVRMLVRRAWHYSDTKGGLLRGLVSFERIATDLRGLDPTLTDDQVNVVLGQVEGLEEIALFRSSDIYSCGERECKGERCFTIYGEEYEVLCGRYSVATTQTRVEPMTVRVEVGGVVSQVSGSPDDFATPESAGMMAVASAVAVAKRLAQ